MSHLSRETGWIKADEIIGRLRQMSADGASRKDVNREYYQAYAGLNRDEVRYLARRWLESMLAVGAQHFFNGAVLSRLRMHAANGVEPVFVSGSAFDLLEPLAAHLRVRRCCPTPHRPRQAIVFAQTLQEKGNAWHSTNGHLGRLGILAADRSYQQ
ncbi:hypothetical protein [Marinobacterium rhizophilum]|uniref:hypothetical protein n=1 Tax=Marinobacterium rhizophilum TaxID=420402 RepID=UPI0012EB9EF1|nr:hypothetical protein [Marinobacterium rhizophilum]